MFFQKQTGVLLTIALHNEEAGVQVPKIQHSASVWPAVRGDRLCAHHWQRCPAWQIRTWFAVVSLSIFTTSTLEKKKKATRNCFLCCITVSAFLYLCGIISSWTSPGHSLCLLPRGQVVAQGKGQVGADWGSKSIPFLVCWITLAFMIRLLYCHFFSSDLVSSAVCHLKNTKKNPTQLQSNRSPQD